VAPRVNLYGASMIGLAERDVKTNTQGVTVSSLEAGLTYLIYLKECKVINFSYHYTGSDDTKDFQQIIDAVTDALHLYMERDDAEFVIVKSAGNDAKDATCDILSYITDPVVKDRIIVVGAAELVDGGAIRVCDFSNFGSRVDLIAPGANIYSTVQRHFLQWSPFINNAYGYMDGTSMAAPHVAGVAAAMWSVNPGLTGAEVKRIICETATGSYYRADRTLYSGSYAMLDAYAAVSAAVGEKTVAPDTSNVPVGLAIGQRAPDFTLNLRGGGTVRLSDLRGKPVLLNFCTTWCPPCQREFPEIQKVADRYGSQIHVLGVSSGEYVSTVNAYFDGYPSLKYPLAFDPDFTVSEVYDIEFIPQTWVLDANGVIVDYIEGSSLESRFSQGLNKAF